MGKKIDRFMLTSLLAMALYFYFASAFENDTIAIIFALLACVVVRKLFNRIFELVGRTSWLQRRQLRRKAGSALIHLACMEVQEATGLVSSLLKKSYQNDAPLILEQLHPSTNLSQERIFDAWRSHRGLEKLVICTTGKCPSESRALASSLKSPRIAVVDAELLGRLFAEHPEDVFPAACEKHRRRLRMQHVLQLVLNRRNAPRCMLFSFSMLVMYVFSGSFYYLLFSLALLLVVCIQLRHAARPAKLF